MRSPLPIDDVLPQLRAALAGHRCAVLSAEPGAGKTTRVPPALLSAPWLEGKKILMLEPRRLAARRAAEYMAMQQKERVGDGIGYRIRGETRVGRGTRIEVLTEGVLTRMLHAEPDLPGVGLVIFDEFHERSLHADLGLALTLDAQTHLREDLRILVMSATLDHVGVSSLLHDAPVVTSTGRIHPVVTHYLASRRDTHLEPAVRQAVLRALREEPGDVLVFLPGQREIFRTLALLEDAGLTPAVNVVPLYGDLPAERQQGALTPSPSGTRKVILATSIAETSLTIDGVRVVIDGGLSRMPEYDVRRGMSGLVTVPVSRATADQRRGRAGRQEPGVCYRLWTEAEHSSLAAFAPPEILSADLVPLALDLARWGSPGGKGLRFLDPPPEAHLTRARSVLEALGVLKEDGSVTPHGRLVAELPVHPRLGHMMVRGKELGWGHAACGVAALLGERDLLASEREQDVDLASRWRSLRGDRGGDRRLRDRVTAEAVRLRTMLGLQGPGPGGDPPGILLGLAYPDRLAKRRGESPRYHTAGGTGAVLPPWSALAREEFLAIGEVDGVGTEVRIRLAAPITRQDIVDAFGPQVRTLETVAWNEQAEAVDASRTAMIGALALTPLPFTPSADLVRAAMREGIRRMGLRVLPWTKEADALVARSEWLRNRGVVPPDWPDLSGEGLLATMEAWLDPFLEGVTRRTQLNRVPVEEAVRSRHAWQQRQLLDRLAPPVLVVPTGSHIRIDYESGEVPVLAVKLQEMFGQTTTPAVAGGAVPVLMHLLSPAGRPLAVTQDLVSFWRDVYPEVRKEMRGRYPKHPWPEDPLAALPTRRTKRHQS